ncbi:MAG: PHB depolymerase family esterase [Polyangiales bacterium]
MGRRWLAAGVALLALSASLGCDNDASPSPPSDPPPTAAVGGDSDHDGGEQGAGGEGGSDDTSSNETAPGSGGAPGVAEGGRGASASGGQMAADSGSGGSSGKSGNTDNGDNPGSAGTGDAPSETARCSGKPGALRGKSRHNLTAAELDRDFIYYAPSTLAANDPVPLVLVAHGFGMNADMMYEITGYAELAEREQLAVVFLNGQPNASGPWNVGDPDCGTSDGNTLPTGRGDDQAYLDAVLRFVESDQCIDARRISMTGFSMGAYFTQETACQRPTLSAAATHSGGSADLSACPSQHKPVLILHFEGDTLVPYRCAQQARDRWVARNGCQLTDPEVVAVTGGQCEYYASCPSDGQVGLCTFTNPAGRRTELYPGHGWSGGSKSGTANSARYAIPETASASELSLQFFKQYVW